MSKSFFFAAGFALLLVAGVGASRLRQKDAKEAKQREESAAHQAELTDAQQVEFGILTDKQRAHSRLFAHYRQLFNGRTIREAIEQAKGHTTILALNVGLGLGPALNNTESPEYFFAELARASDAVIRGKVTNKNSYVTEDEGFILTDYDILVSEVLKDNAIGAIDVGSKIVFVQPGGKVAIDGMIVKASDDAFSALPRSGNDVVLFMKFITQSGSYKATRYDGSFELDGSSLRPLTKDRLPKGVVQDAPSFLQTARAVSKS